jgi:hypothetical protein
MKIKEVEDVSSNKQSERVAKNGSLGAITAGALLGAGAVLLASKADREKAKQMTQDVMKRVKSSLENNIEKAEESVQNLSKKSRQLASSVK